MVGVAQLVEPRIVIPVVVGSSPIVHPIFLIERGGRSGRVESRSDLLSGFVLKINLHRTLACGCALQANWGSSPIVHPIFLIERGGRSGRVEPRSDLLSGFVLKINLHRTLAYGCALQANWGSNPIVHPNPPSELRSGGSDW